MLLGSFLVSPLLFVVEERAVPILSYRQAVGLEVGKHICDAPKNACIVVGTEFGKLRIPAINIALRCFDTREGPTHRS